jgi:hypothetical protein
MYAFFESGLKSVFQIKIRILDSDRGFGFQIRI